MGSRAGIHIPGLDSDPVFLHIIFLHLLHVHPGLEIPGIPGIAELLGFRYKLPAFGTFNTNSSSFTYCRIGVGQLARLGDKISGSLFQNLYANIDFTFIKPRLNGLFNT